MGNSPTPPGLLERILLKVDERIASFARSGFLRNATISDGGLTIKGGFLRLRNALNTFNPFYVGPVSPTQPDGTPQQGWIVRRADGTTVLLMRDAFPVDGPAGVNQSLNWYDRAGNVVLADDTDSGQGLARPYVPGVFYRARNVDWPTVTDASFQVVYRAKLPKQQPRLYVRAWGWNDTAGGTGELKVMVNGAQLGATVATSNAGVTEYVFGPAAVAGAHMDTLIVEIQARMVSGAGGVQVAPSQMQGQQS